MAVTGTYTKASGYYTLKLEVTETSTSTANNTSTLSWKLTLLTGSTYFSSVRVGYTVKIDGTTVGSLNYTNATAKSMNKNDSWEMASGTTTVTHGTDGSKTIAAGAITAVLNTQTGNIVPNISLASGSALVLTTIPRAATITTSASSTLMGTNRTITVTKQVASHYVELSYSFGSATGTIGSRTQSTSITWTVPTSLAAQVASGSIRASGTITCKTYTSSSGGSAIGTSTASFIAQIPPTVPTTSASDNHMGKSRTVSVSSRVSANLTHTLTYTFGNGSGTITTKTASTSVSWTVPTSLAQYVATNNASGSGTITCTTFNGDAEVGTKTVSFTAAIPASTMTKANATMGKSTSFTVTRAGSNLSHKITYAFGGSSGTAVATSSGTSLSWTPPYSLASELAITSGTKSGTITYTLTTYNGTASCGTNTYTATLSAPSASLTVPSSFTMGTAKAITITEQDASFTHTITGTFEGTTDTFATKTAATSVNATWATATFGALIPTTKSSTGTVKHTAYSGNVVVAYNEYTTTVSVPSTAPTATISTAVVTSLASPFNTVYIQNNSQVKVSVTLSSPTGAYLDKATMTIDGVTKSYSVSANVTSWTGKVTSNLLQTSGTRTITVKVTDKRGYSGTYTTTISVTAYSNPTISAASGESKVIIERSNPQGTADPAGACLHLKFVRKISAITNNTGYVSYKVGSGTATTISTSTNGSQTIDQTLNLGWSEHNTYQVTVRVWDSVGYEVTRTVTIPSLNVTLDLRQGGLGVGIGMFSQGDNRFDVAWDSYFSGTILAPYLRAAQAAASGGRSRIVVVENINFNDAGVSSSDPTDTFLEAWLKKVCADYPTTDYVTFIGQATPGSRGIVICYVYDCANLSNGLPEYAHGVFLPLLSLSATTMLHRFGTNEYTFFDRVVYSETVSAGTPTYTTNSLISSTQFAKFHLRKVGKVVTMYTYGEVAPEAASGGTTWTDIGKVPSGFEPVEQTRIYIPLRAAAYYGMGIGVNASGVIQAYKNNTSSNILHFNMSWIQA